MKNRESIITYLLILIITISTNYVVAQQNKLQYNDWIKNWHLLGPIQLEEGMNEDIHLGGFENNILSSHGGESNFQLQSGQTELFNGSTFTWIEYTNPDSIIYLDQILSTKSYVAAYAYTEIYAEKEAVYVFALGTNDGGRLWINGEEVWDYPGSRGVKPDEDLISVILKKGVNRVLLKIEDRGYSWGFCARILPYNADTYELKAKYFNVVTMPNGDLELRCSINENILGSLYNSIKLEIYTNDNDSSPIWKGDWTKKMKLAINYKSIKSYLFKIICDRKDGDAYTLEFTAKDKSPILSMTPNNSPDTLKVLMLSPQYRNAIYATMDPLDNVKIKIKIDMLVGDLDDVFIDVALSRDGNSIKSWNFSSLRNEMILNLPVSDITFENTRSGPYVKDDNPYKFKIALQKDGVILEIEELELNKYPAAPDGINEVRIDDDHNLLINGERRFIFGAYLDRKDSNYNYLERIGLNGFVESGSHLDKHSKSSWGIIHIGHEPIHVKSELITYRGKSNLLAYQTADEPNIPKSYTSPAVLQETYEIIKKEDPYHPTTIVWQIKNRPNEPIGFNGFGNCTDIFMLDIYPFYKDWLVNDEDVGVISQNYKLLKNHELGESDWEHEETPLFSTFQILDVTLWRISNANTEIINQVYQNLAGGARSFFPYSYSGKHKQEWEYYAKTLKPEVESIMEAVQTKENNEGVSIFGENTERLVWSRRVTKKNEYLFLINTSSKWNMLNSEKKKEIDINITFNTSGGSVVDVVVGDSTTPASYTIVDNKIRILLDGIDERSSGVIVLKRSVTK